MAAGLSIAVCRGFLLNFGVYYATLEALNVPFQWSPAVAFMARFMTVFAGVIAVTKDLPDVEGDKQFKVKTLATKFGVEKVAKAATFALGLNYLSAVAQGLFAPAAKFNRLPMVLGEHLRLIEVTQATRCSRRFLAATSESTSRTGPKNPARSRLYTRKYGTSSTSSTPFTSSSETWRAELRVPF